jgi:hypothetical protein
VAKPVLVTCGPSRLYFRGLARASGDCHFLLQSQYGIATKPVLVTCGPSRPNFRGVARAYEDCVFLLPSEYGVTRKPVLVTGGPYNPYFQSVGKGVWGGSLPITIPIWNSGKPVYVTFGLSRPYFRTAARRPPCQKPLKAQTLAPRCACHPATGLRTAHPAPVQDSSAVSRQQSRHKPLQALTAARRRTTHRPQAMPAARYTI